MDDLKARISRREQWGKSVDRAEQELFVEAMRAMRAQIKESGLDKELMKELRELAVLSNEMKKAYEEAVNDTMQHIAGREDSLLRTYVEAKKAESESGGSGGGEFGGRVNGILFSNPGE